VPVVNLPYVKRHGRHEVEGEEISASRTRRTYTNDAGIDTAGVFARGDSRGRVLRVKSS